MRGRGEGRNPRPKGSRAGGWVLGERQPARRYRDECIVVVPTCYEQARQAVRGA